MRTLRAWPHRLGVCPFEPQDPIWLRITRPAQLCPSQVSPPSSPRDKPHGWFSTSCEGWESATDRVDASCDAELPRPESTTLPTRSPTTPHAYDAVRGLQRRTEEARRLIPSGAVLSSFGRQQWAGGGFCECWVRAQLAQRDRASGLLRVQPELAQQLGKLSFRESQLRPKSPHEDGLEVGNCEHGGLVVHSLVG